MTRLVAVAVVIAGGVVASAQSRAPSPGDHIIDLNITLDLPVNPCAVPRIVLTVARALRVPAGAEALPVRCTLDSPASIVERVPLISMHLKDALDVLVKADPRYLWMESDGVIIVRPSSAWANDKHFLNTVIDRYELADDNIGAALDAILARFRPPGHAGAEIMAGVGRLTLSLGPISVLEALDAVVRAHGAAHWSVVYCLPEVAPDVAMLNLMTYEKRGIGTSVAKNRLDAEGRPIMCSALP
jgi:hypothetical protein